MPWLLLRRLQLSQEQLRGGVAGGGCAGSYPIVHVPNGIVEEPSPPRIARIASFGLRGVITALGFLQIPDLGSCRIWGQALLYAGVHHRFSRLDFVLQGSFESIRRFVAHG